MRFVFCRGRGFRDLHSHQLPEPVQPLKADMKSWITKSVHSIQGIPPSTSINFSGKAFPERFLLRSFHAGCIPSALGFGLERSGGALHVLADQPFCSAQQWCCTSAAESPTTFQDWRDFDLKVHYHCRCSCHVAWLSISDLDACPSHGAALPSHW